MSVLRPKCVEFIGALPIAKAQGLLPWAVLVHAWNESAGFSRIAGDFNVWGITASSSYVAMAAEGMVVNCPTHEVEAKLPGESMDTAKARLAKKWGKVVTSIEPYQEEPDKFWYIGLERWFKDWVSMRIAMMSYCGLVQRLYPASAKATNEVDYFTGLTKGALGSWATNPRYKQELCELSPYLRGRKDVVSAMKDALLA